MSWVKICIVRRVARWRTAFYAWLEDIRFRTGMAVVVGVLAIAGGVTAALIATTGGAAAQASRPLARPAPATLPQLTAGPDVVPSTAAKPTASKSASQTKRTAPTRQEGSLVADGQPSSAPDPAATTGPSQHRSNPWGSGGSGGWWKGQWPPRPQGGDPWPGHGGWPTKGGWPTRGGQPSGHWPQGPPHGSQHHRWR